MLFIVDDMRDFSVDDTLGESYIMCRSCADALDLLERYTPREFSEIWLDYNLGVANVEAVVHALARYAGARSGSGQQSGALPKIRVLTDDRQGLDFIEYHLSKRYEFLEPPESCNELWLERHKD
jgi:hypothetical protein